MEIMMMEKNKDLIGADGVAGTSDLPIGALAAGPVISG